MITIDQIIDDSIKVGKFQYLSLLIVSLIDFSDGIEKTLIGTMLTIFKYQWNLSQTQVSILASVYFVGIVIGTIICAFLTDVIGRKATTQYTCLIAFGLMVWNSFVTTYGEVILVRLLFGIIFGITIPLGHIIISEIVPAKIRGQVMTVVATIFIIGKVYCTLLQMVFLDDYKSGNWRMLLLVNSIPLFMCFLGACLFIRDSPRYYFSKQLYAEGLRELQHMGQVNHGPTFTLSIEQQNGLVESQQQINQYWTKQVSFKHLFSKQFIGFTIRIWVVFMLTSIVETTLYILMPFWLDNQNNGFLSQLYLMLAELAAGITVFFVVDLKSLGGRKWLVVIISILIGLVSGGIYYIQESVLVFGLSLVSFLLKLMFTLEMVIMNESYTTQYRAMGVGLTQTMGKLMGVIWPFLIFPLYYQDNYSPFLLYSVSMAVLSGMAATFPFDMTQVELDNVDVFKQQKNIDSLVSDDSQYKEGTN